MRRRHASSAVGGGRGAAGFALTWALVVVFLTLQYNAISLTRTTSDLRVSHTVVQTEQAFHLAEAGLNHALSVLKLSSVVWDDELRGPDDTPGTSDDGILSFGPEVSTLLGSYAVRVSDNQDEVAPNPNDPALDQDGVIRVTSQGTVGDIDRAVVAWVWSLFNYAVAAQVDIVTHEDVVLLGNIHANHDIRVFETGTLAGNSQATASGAFLWGLSGTDAGITLVHTAGDLEGGDPPIWLFHPDEEALRNAVDRWDPVDWNATIVLFNQEIAGYDRGHDLAPDTVILDSPGSAATLVVFGGDDIRFREDLGVFLGEECVTPVAVNLIALGGGAITFEQRACLEGLIWAEGPIQLAEKSNITGAIVSANSTVLVAEKSQISFDRTKILPSLLTGFRGTTQLTWMED